ncbi:hypothetical protein VJ786_00645 [Sphingobacterium sp. PU5-4]|uniref:Redox-active disulfide protein 2 n=1 Tax=Sphingobacterium tenebrionis TaxID=3111775 RepID=A0ABU8I1H9_9SPHI
MKQLSLRANSLGELIKKRKFLQMILLIGALVLTMMLTILHLYFFKNDMISFPVMLAAALFTLLPAYKRLGEINTEIKSRTDARRI